MNDSSTLLLETPQHSPGSLSEDVIAAAARTKMTLGQRIRRCRQLAIEIHKPGFHNPIGEAYERFADGMEKEMRHIDNASSVGDEKLLNGCIKVANEMYLSPLLHLESFYNGVEETAQLENLTRAHADMERLLSVSTYLAESHEKGEAYFHRNNLPTESERRELFDDQ
jgi:hypothetical protein